MSHAIHKIVSKERCQSYFISRRSPHLGISKDSELCASAHRCLHYAYARLIARVTFHLPIKFHQRIQLCGHIHHHGIQDGVLLDSMGIWNDLGARYLRSLGVTPEEGLNEILFSMSMEQGAEYLHTHYALPQSAAEVGAGIADMLRDFYFYEVPAKDGAAALLAALTARGVKLAAATSSPREHVTRALERLGLLGYFTRLFTTAEVGVSKHEPTIYLLAAEALHAAPAETLVFEDSLYALKTAKAAGFYTVGVYDADGETDQAGLQMAADLYVRDLHEAKAALL